MFSKKMFIVRIYKQKIWHIGDCYYFGPFRQWILLLAVLLAGMASRTLQMFFNAVGFHFKAELERVKIIQNHFSICK